MRRVEHQQIEPGAARGEQARRPAVQPREVVDGLGAAQRVDHRRVAGDQRVGVDAVARQRRGQRADDIREAAGLDQRIDLGRDRKDAQALHFGRRSIIGCVMRHTPRSVRRKRAASTSGSSPTTSPSGIFTPESTITSVSLACRPIST